MDKEQREWEQAEDDILIEMKKTNATYSAIRDAIESATGSRRTVGAVKTRWVHRLQFELGPSQETVLSLRTPWVSAGTRRFIDAVRRHDRFAIPAAEEVQAYLNDHGPATIGAPAEAQV